MSRRIILLSICCLLLTDGNHSLLLPPTIQHHQYNNYRRSNTSCLASSSKDEEILPPRRVKIRARPTATSKLKGGSKQQQISSVISKPRKRKSAKSTVASTTAAKSTTVKSSSKAEAAVSKSKTINSNTKLYANTRNRDHDNNDKKKKPNKMDVEQKWYKPTIHTKSGQVFQHQEMLDHTILSFNEEIQYGRQIVKARQIKEKILTIIDEREERKELNELEMLNDDDDSSGDLNGELGVGLDSKGVNNNEEDGLDMEFLNYELEYLSVYGFRPNKDSAAANPEENDNSIAGLDLEDDLLINHAQHRSQHLSQLTSDTNYFTPPPKSNNNSNNKGMGQHKRTGYRNSSTSSIAQRNSYTSLLHLPLQELSNYDISHTLQISGGRQELIDILLDGAYAREVLMRRNVKLVMSISKNWMRNSFSTANSNLSGAGASAGGGAGGNSNGGKKSSDKSTKKYLSQMYEGSWDRPSLDEAVQEGMLGLARAVDKYDPERGLRFSTYATHWITSYVRICFQRAVTGCLRVPSQLHDIKNKYNKIVKDHIQIGEEVPEQEYIAEQLGISEQRLRTAIRATGSLVSVDAPIGSGNGGSYKGSMAGGDGSNSQELLILDTLKW